MDFHAPELTRAGEPATISHSMPNGMSDCVTLMRIRYSVVMRTFVGA